MPLKRKSTGNDLPHIGLDLDNTLIDYDAVFGPVGVELGLLPKAHANYSKTRVREFLRRTPEGERAWMRLQGQVYGHYLDRATPFDGVGEFLRRFQTAGVNISIVSHKTRHGHFDPLRIDLWDAARQWLATGGFLDPDGLGIDRDSVYFEETREAKLARITALGCDVFIDDLPEVLLHLGFPASTIPLWFGNGQSVADGGGLPCYQTWEQLAQAAHAALFP